MAGLLVAQVFDEGSREPERPPHLRGTDAFTCAPLRAPPRARGAVPGPCAPGARPSVSGEPDVGGIFLMNFGIHKRTDPTQILKKWTTRVSKKGHGGECDVNLCTVMTGGGCSGPSRWTEAWGLRWPASGRRHGSQWRVARNAEGEHDTRRREGAEEGGVE